MPAQPTKKIRWLPPAVRLLVLDAEQRLLLFHIHDAAPVHVFYPGMTIYWCTPGGGLEPGESFEQAARRELWEETGIEVEAVGPCVWHYERVMQIDDQRLHRHERFFVINAPTVVVSLANMLAYEHETHRAYRWWTRQELEQSGEWFLPRDLPRLLAPLLDGALPSAPIQLPS
jgi:8-oxo-dGTP pyrophosphatase MutT (NUDIX family)